VSETESAFAVVDTFVVAAAACAVVAFAGEGGLAVVVGGGDAAAGLTHWSSYPRMDTVVDVAAVVVVSDGDGVDGERAVLWVYSCHRC
jgi:hypothetical protein